MLELDIKGEIERRGKWKYQSSPPFPHYSLPWKSHGVLKGHTTPIIFNRLALWSARRENKIIRAPHRVKRNREGKEREEKRENRRRENVYVAMSEERDWNRDDDRVCVCVWTCCGCRWKAIYEFQVCCVVPFERERKSSIVIFRGGHITYIFASRCW